LTRGAQKIAKIISTADTEAPIGRLAMGTRILNRIPPIRVMLHRKPPGFVTLDNHRQAGENGRSAISKQLSAVSDQLSATGISGQPQAFRGHSSRATRQW
jgi:hypothetical protein